MNEARFGTIRVGNDIKMPGLTCQEDAEIALGDSGTLWDNRLGWLYHDGKLISDRSAIFGPSYDRLDNAGLCGGLSVIIDGMSFTTRLMEGDPDSKHPSEVDLFLDEHGAKMLKSFQKEPYWCLSHQAMPPMRLYRGGGARRAGRFEGYCRGDGKGIGACLGYRPILIPEGFNPKRIHVLQGKRMNLYGPKGFVAGILTEITDYDLVLVVPEGELMDLVLVGCQGFAQEVGRYKIAVDRDKVWCIQPVYAQTN